jgi:uncharacterized membrane protein YfcA
MPLIMISAFGALMPPEIALAGLILPTVVTNISQALRQGFTEAWASVVKFYRLIIPILVGIPLSAPFVTVIPEWLYLLVLGIPVTAFALVQLLGLPLAIRLEHRNRAQWVLGLIGGLYGGVAGIWGPPILVYLLSIRAEKTETVRVQGVIFFLGAVVLLMSHLGTGVMNAATVPFSAALVVPAVLGLMLGYAVQDRLPQAAFRRATQALLVLTGLNLIWNAFHV